ncbi:HTTM domain-containing protein [Runella sp. MFBS21]|uniref:HTTM domain-containing protein n=1 Tax=Runella sp. MFBS21 TaxID=3034018 RepID=UPI0023F77E83|nr:HTTM domain-containing protein [Runella sp. MFBS21]MDF7822263.1 HTTM domain-containing protein [Runella sp. MFBS21]
MSKLQDYIFIQKWNSFWFINGPVHSLAIFRILFGIYWLTRLIWWSPYVALFFSREGMYFPANSVKPIKIFNLDTLLAWLTHSPSETQGWFIYIISLILILLIIIGFYTRIVLLLFFLFLNYYYYAYLYVYGTSYDRLIIIITFFLCLSPCGFAISLDQWLANRRGDIKKKNHPLWTQRMICIQIVIVYFATGVHKLTSSAWINGDNLQSALYGDYATSLGFWISQKGFSKGYYDLATIIVILFEISMPVLLLNKKMQKWAFIFGTLFHVANSSILWIPEFLVVICTYILFVDPNLVKKYLYKISDNELNSSILL